MNILVTGSNGQLGNEMVRVSGNSKDRYVFTDIAELDITNLDDVLALVQKERIDVIALPIPTWTSQRKTKRRQT